MPKPSINAKLRKFGLKIDVLPIKRLKRSVTNPRSHDLKSIEAIRRSIQAFGFKNVVIVDKKLEVIAGFGRLESAELEGQKEVPVLIALDLDKWQIRALRIADNRTAEFSDWNEETLHQELLELKAGLVEEVERLGNPDLTLEVTGFDERILNAPPTPAPSKDNYTEQYGVIVICEDEKHQEDVYKKLKDEGYTCKVVTT